MILRIQPVSCITTVVIRTSHPDFPMIAPTRPFTDIHTKVFLLASVNSNDEMVLTIDRIHIACICKPLPHELILKETIILN